METMDLLEQDNQGGNPSASGKEDSELEQDGSPSASGQKD